MATSTGLGSTRRACVASPVVDIGETADKLQYDLNIFRPSKNLQVNSESCVKLFGIRDEVRE
jgi:hypothetical protein